MLTLFYILFAIFIGSLVIVFILGQLNLLESHSNDNIPSNNIKPNSYQTITTDYDAFCDVIHKWMKERSLPTIKDVAIKCGLNEHENYALLELLILRYNNPNKKPELYDVLSEKYFNYYEVMKKCIDYVPTDLWHNKY